MRHSDWDDAVKVFRLLLAFRRRGHLAARLDPLRGSAHRPLSPLEPINWRIGGSHGTRIERVDINRFLGNGPEGSCDLSVFGLQHFKDEDELPAGVKVPSFWGPPPSASNTASSSSTSPTPAPAPSGVWRFRDLTDHLRRCYADTLSLEYQHLEGEHERLWLEERFEGRFQAMSSVVKPEMRSAALLQLLRADQLEIFFGQKFPSAKRFGVRGLETLLPCLWALTGRGAELGLEQMQLGMAHRGRLNVLVNFLGKRLSEVCNEFSEQLDFLGDMKYHLGTRGTVNIEGKDVRLTLAPNPSHLEAVNPVVLGMTRAKQDYDGDSEKLSTMALLIHGDAAFSGQGIIAECLQLADLPEYSTGGTVHIVLNNNIGFTTDPRAARSSYHCTNVAKVNDAPIIHVNADDVDAVLFAAVLAAEYRQAMRKDIVLDLVGYRRLGHNEMDDDSLTQPLTRAKVQQHPPVSSIYGERLVADGLITREELENQIDQIADEFEAEYQYSTSASPSLSEWQPQNADFHKRPVNVTGLPIKRLQDVGKACTRVPEGFEIHESVKKIFDGRLRQLAQQRVDWALAEQLAIGSLILNFSPDSGDDLTTGLIQPADEEQSDCADDEAEEVDCYVVHPPCPVRLSGQDVERGTFNQRHSIIHDQLTAIPHNVFDDLGLGQQSRATVCNSSLSELAILGFEYGYSLEESLALTIWEAQFGDFANCAQHIIDNFIVSGETKWDTKSCLVLLLPHGYEGQGPEHSSARLERFLQLLDDDPQHLWPGGVAGAREAVARAQEAQRELQAAEEEEEQRKAIATANAGRTTATAAPAQEQPASLRLKQRQLQLDRALRSIELLQEGYDYKHNIAVVNLTTPANLFHALRRQVHRTFAKPLIVMSAKYLLHHRPCRSPLSHMSKGTRFRRVIEAGGVGDNMPARQAAKKDGSPAKCQRLIFCSGKVFYELHHACNARKTDGSIVLARVEQLAPFPSLEVALCAGRYPEAEVVWVQEEPKNMGAWSFVEPRFRSTLKSLLDDDRGIRFIGRPSSATSATPLFKHHKREVRTILDEALEL